MTWKTVLLLGAVVGTAIGCHGDEATAPEGTAASVDVLDYAFSPDSVTIPVGARVFWEWKGKAVHNVVFDENPTQLRSAGKITGSYHRNFPEPGVYTYYCEFHGREVMSGVVVVE
ncbi:MAG TPA: plastocyanin/azurin family copper-binding protein [Longimicrobiales bacterium]